ncbi:MAG: hypothetical protein IPM92_03410 [Saprospiraceae bacterium]|nr:hypothetical protein [Saprospiraceae bacterium]
MAYELWRSNITGTYRKRATFKELQDTFTNYITTRFIYEDIYCCRITDSVSDVKSALKERNFDIAGVRDTNGKLIGCVNNLKLG